MWLSIVSGYTMCVRSGQAIRTNGVEVETKMAASRDNDARIPLQLATLVYPYTPGSTDDANKTDG